MTSAPILAALAAALAVPALTAAALLLPAAAAAQTSVIGSAGEWADGWEVRRTQKSYADLLAALKAAVPAEGMAVVTEAGPTEAAAARGETIPGNRVIGIFRNDFAVSLIRAAPAAMIEAPIRIMVMEEPDGTATLAWKRPSAVLALYGSDSAAQIGSELDAIFGRIATRAAE
jgi:uncharacterized protein (DUF302 family)